MQDLPHGIGVGRFVHDLVRRHVPGCADDRAAVGGGRHDADVGQLRMAVDEDDVGRFDVPMDQAGVVEFAKPLQ